MFTLQLFEQEQWSNFCQRRYLVAYFDANSNLLKAGTAAVFCKVLLCLSTINNLPLMPGCANLLSSKMSFISLCDLVSNES